MSTDVQDLLGTLRKINYQNLDWELRKLQGIREWAIRNIGVDYAVGDRVQIVSPIPGNSTNGWRAYAECLHVGATGIVKSIDFVVGDGRWIVDFVPDREWAVGGFSETMRWWHGPADETPDGYEPPSKYERDNYPEGRKHTFMFRPEWLTKVVE